MDPFVPTLIILTAAGLAILLIIYRIWASRVEAPRKLEDEIAEALEGRRADVESIEPVRAAAAALSYYANKIVIVRNFGKSPTRVYAVRDLIGIEVFVNDKVVARILRGGPHKMFDDIAPQIERVTIRLVFIDPAQPDFELPLWTPQDALTARAEGPRGALETARRWFYHVEAIIRRPLEDIIREVEPAPPKPTLPAPEALSPDPTPPPAARPAPSGKSPTEGDVLNAPIIPYL